MPSAVGALVTVAMAQYQGHLDAWNIVRVDSNANANSNSNSNASASASATPNSPSAGRVRLHGRGPMRFSGTRREGDDRLTARR